MEGEIYWSEKNFYLCEKRTKFHFKLTMRPLSQNWSVEHLRCSATIHWMLFNTSIIINLVYFIQYKFTFHMLKHPKLCFFLSKDLPKMLSFYDTLLNGKGGQYYKNQRQMLSFFTHFIIMVDEQIQQWFLLNTMEIQTHECIYSTPSLYRHLVDQAIIWR